MLAPLVKRIQTEAPAAPKSLPLWQALFYFAIPAFLFRLILYNGTGYLVTHGVVEVTAVVLAFLVPSVLLLLAAFVAMRLDGYSLSWSVIRERFRFHPLTWRSWLWVVGGALVALVGEQLLAFTGVLLVHIPIFTPPAYLSFLNPTVRQSLSSFLGVSLRGNWAFFALFTAIVVVQVAAEECWWRGYLFVFYPWSVIVDLFFCSTVAYVFQRTKNTWVSLLIHLLYNGLTPIALLLAVLGVIH